PAEDYITISAGEKCNSMNQNELRILNIFGEQVLNFQVQSSLTQKNISEILNEGNSIRLDISLLPAGVYFINICCMKVRFVKINAN
ncbi:MAG: hypothetical protein QG635_1994, partial [Bacteroidota bacterium]|nr:hypothetical protein [Bacteroidota bacterium]